jgi:gliding motility-associated-like protein
VGSDAQSICVGDVLATINYTIGGSATGASLTGTLPTGVNGSYDANSKVFSISGTPSSEVASPFSYSIATTGACPVVLQTGSIAVFPIYTPVVTCGASSGTSVEFLWTALTDATNYILSYTVNGGSVQNGGSTTNTSFTVNALFPGDVVVLTVRPMGGGCYASASASCNAVPCAPITVSVPTSITLCNGETVAATNFVSTPPGATFTWKNTVQSVGISTTGIGQIAAFNASNLSSLVITTTIEVIPTIGLCVGTPSTYTITVNPTFTPSFSEIPAFCSGTIAPLLPAASNDLVAVVGTWNPAIVSNTASASYTFTPNAGTCATTQILNTTVVDSFQVDAGADALICSGQKVQLSASATAAVSFAWNTDSRGSVIEVSPIENSVYVLTGSIGACIASDSVQITLKDSIAPTLFIPNAFTPNEDNINDEFKVFGEGIVEFDGNIFDRWGELIFHWDNIEGGWDGKRAAKDLVMSEVYVYSIRVKNECRADFENVRIGSVTVIK